MDTQFVHDFILIQNRKVADNKVLSALMLSAANKVNSIINKPKGKGFICNNVILITGTYSLAYFELIDIIMLFMYSSTSTFYQTTL